MEVGDDVVVVFQTFDDCSCISDSLTSAGAGGVALDTLVRPSATSGACERPCDSLEPFMIMLFLLTFTVAMIQMPLLMVTMRSVGEEERAFSLGMQFVILRLTGNYQLLIERYLMLHSTSATVNLVYNIPRIQ